MAQPRARNGGHRRVRDKSWRSLWKKSSGPHRAFFVGLVLVGAVLRVHQAMEPITYAEALAYTSLSVKPLGVLLTDQHVFSGHVLHALLVKISTGLFGTSLWSLRLPALVAGIIALPLFHWVVRALFNRHVALIALALAAASGGLVELSAVARGYSLTWVFLLLMLHDGRTYAVTERQWPIRRMALWTALGVWTTPGMVFPALTAYVWLMLHVRRSYETSLRRRSVGVLRSLGMAVVLSLLCYVPAVLAHGLDALIDNASMPPRTVATFTEALVPGLMENWGWFAETSSIGLVVVCWLGLCYSLYLSGRFRDLFGALVVGMVLPMVLMLYLPGPEYGAYALFWSDLSTAIALFHVLKVVQDKLLPGFDERFRTLVACAASLLVFAPLGLLTVRDRIPRFPEATFAATWAKEHLGPDDRVLVVAPWDAPLEFAFRAAGLGAGHLHGPVAPQARTFIVVGTAKDQTPERVLDHFAYQHIQATRLSKVEDWRRLEIFAAQ